MPSFFIEELASYLNFRKILYAYSGFLSQYKTEVDTDWSNDVGLWEWLSFTMCCGNTEGIKEDEGILMVLLMGIVK